MAGFRRFSWFSLLITLWFLSETQAQNPLSWTRTHDFGNGVRPRSLIAHSDGSIYAGVDDNSDPREESVRRSTNGITWNLPGGRQLVGGSPTYLRCYSLLELADKTILGGINYSSTETEIWTSDNGGASDWIQHGNTILTDKIIGDMVQASDGTIYAGTRTANGDVYKYVSGTWTNTGNLAGAENINVLATAGTVVYAGATGASTGRVFQTLDAGTNWTELVAIGLPPVSATSVNDLLVTRGGTLFAAVSRAAGGQICRWTGSAWTNVLTTDYAVYRLLEDYEGTIHASKGGDTDGPDDIASNGDETTPKIYYSTDGGTNWAEHGALPLSGQGDRDGSSFQRVVQPNGIVLGLDGHVYLTEFWESWIWKSTGTLPTPPRTTMESANFTNLSTAVLVGDLVSTGGAATAVWVGWCTNSPAPMSTDPADWLGGNVTNLGVQSLGPVTNIVNNLASNTAYYCRFMATNAYGATWSDESTFSTGHVPVVLDEYDLLRLRWEEVLTGGTNYSLADPYIQAKLTNLYESATNWWTTMVTNAGRTNLWVDIPPDTSGNDAYKSLARLLIMAQAYRCKGSPIKDNAELRDDIIEATDFIYSNWYNSSRFYPDNGWMRFEMTIPRYLSDVTILMYDDLTPTQVSNYMGAIAHFTPTIAGYKGFDFDGANLLSKLRGMTTQGILSKDSARIFQARNGLDPELAYVTSGEGFYRDGSWVFHDAFPYTGGYGTSFLVYLTEVMFLLAGTTWDITNPNVDNVYEWIYESYQPVIWRGDVMDGYRGRTISFYNKTAISYGNALQRGVLMLVPGAPTEDQTTYKRMLKYWVQENTFSDYLESCSLYQYVKLKAIMDDAGVVSRGDLVKYKQYHNMARAVHFRPGWAFSISMHSHNIFNYESLDGLQNPKGWHTGDGMTYLYSDDLAQFAESFWCTVNMRRLPGTTVSTNQSPVERKYNGNNWVGGAEWKELYGVTGFWLKPYNQTLSAKKSWFMFDDEIVALGSDIDSSDNQHVETIVENRRLTLAGGTNSIVVNGVAKSTSSWSQSMANVNWVHVAGNVPTSGSGYYFPSPANLEGMREDRVGQWVDVNPQYATDDTFTNTFMTLFFKHGYNPANASYQYVLLPNRSEAQVGAYAANPEIVVLTNSTSVHAVKETTLNLIGANFWTDTSQTVDIITCNRKASIMLQDFVTNMTVAVADPTQNGSSITVTLDREATGVVSKDSQITVSQLSPNVVLTVNVSGSRGKTYSVTLDLPDQDGDGVPNANDNDDDNDGSSDADEAVAGTDPLDAGSALQILSVGIEGDAFRIHWQGGTSAWQYLECKADLVSTTEPWRVVFTNIPPTSVMTNVLDLVSTDQVLFYRIRVESS